MQQPTYPAILSQSLAGEFTVSFPDFPGTHGTGQTVDDAALAAAESLSTRIESMLAGGDEIPRPSAGPLDCMMSPSARVQSAILFRWHMQGIKKTDLLRALNTSWARLRDLETAGRNISIDRADAAARALGFQLVLSYVPLGTQGR